jgi:hypothetical protein
LNLAFYFFIGIIALLLSLFVWSQRQPKKEASSPTLPTGTQDLKGSAVTHLSQVRQALSREDDQFLDRAAGRELRQRIKRDRRRVVLKYLLALRQDFEGLLRTAKIIAVLSPEIGVGQEFERLRLTMTFLWRLRMIQLAVYAGYAPQPQVDDLSNLISGLSIRLEAAMKKLGERAALVAEMASSSDRRRVGLT